MINYEKLTSEIAENVRALIAESGYQTVAAFCAATGLPSSTVSRLASGERVPTLQSLVDIANATGTSLAKLLGPEAF